MGKGEHILSPIFNVRYSYLPKAVNYVRYSGSANFGMGGQAHDVMNIIKQYGFIPEEVYNGMNIGEDKHNHAEMDGVSKQLPMQLLKHAAVKLLRVGKKCLNQH